MHTIETTVPRTKSYWRARLGRYLGLAELLNLIPDNEPLKQLLKDNWKRMLQAPGSTHNHQAWSGGYLDHVVETMNIACRLWRAFFHTGTRLKKPFVLADALVVMFLHDLEKPFKDKPNKKTKVGSYDAFAAQLVIEEGAGYLTPKIVRRRFRDSLAAAYGVVLTAEQKNALQYVEGEYEDYTSKERKMGELAAFCHCCDILSARLWHDRGKEQKW